jgi:Calcineurin-like phosphoesterase
VPYWAIAVVAVVVLATIAALVVIARKPPEYANPVLVGAGDISSCHNDSDDATARLLEDIPGTVFTMGDNAYPSGTSFQFKDCYGPNWGEYKARTKPAVGNHEYETDGAAGYFDYFGSAAGPPSKGYYSYDLGDWHVVVLNSMCEEVGGCGPGSPMVGWLRKDLAANPNNKCTLAYFHHPLFSSGEHGNQTKMTASWEALYEANADVVVNGHDHDYERFAPQTPDGAADPAQGIREFVVGTGGAERRPFSTIQPNSEARDDNTPGVLKLTLKPAGYDWKFVPVAGEIFTDSGTGSCH